MSTGNFKKLPTRLIQKCDTETNWNTASENGFVPLRGEFIIYEEDENYDKSRVKVGDGSTVVGDLPFFGDTDESLTQSGVAADAKITGEKISVLEQWVANNTPGGGGGSGSSSTIEVPTTIEWDTSVTPTTTIDLTLDQAYTLYKIADATPTKEQVLAAQWTLSDYSGQTTFDVTISESDIQIDSEDCLMFQFSSTPSFGYVVYYTTGDVSVDVGGVTVVGTVLETGLYQVWGAEATFPTTMYGSCTYTTTMELNFIQPDWTQNDITKEDYIKNRPFYVDTIFQKIFPASTLAFTPEGANSPYLAVITPSAELLEFWESEWSELNVEWDGIEYVCKPQLIEGVLKGVGNVGLMVGAEDTGEPFIFIIIPEGMAGEGIPAMGMFYSTNEFADSVANETVTIAAVDGTSYYSAPITTLELVESNTYKVQIDGNNYDAMMAVRYEQDGITYIGIGNNTIIGIGNEVPATDVPFFIYTATDSGGTKTNAVVTTESSPTSYNILVWPVDPITHTISLSALGDSVHTLDPKFLGDVPWDKVSNKPFGTIPAGSVFVNETITIGPVSDDSINIAPMSTINTDNFVIDALYVVSINGVNYDGVGTSMGGMTGVLINNASGDDMIAGIVLELGGLIYFDSTTFTEGSTYDIKVTIAQDAVKTLDPVYLPDGLSGLPESSTSDSGKVLTVGTDGTAAWATPASGLPTVSTSYNGKILKVVSGAWSMADETKELPTVTSDNDGKVLTVSGGTWTAVTPTPELPTVTTEDDGKFLRVVNGVWAAQTVQNAEEVLF